MQAKARRRGIFSLWLFIVITPFEQRKKTKISFDSQHTKLDKSKLISLKKDQKMMTTYGLLWKAVILTVSGI